MSLWGYRGAMRENQISPFGKLLIVMVLAFAAVSAATNLSHGVVPHPAAFVLSVIGFLLFLTAKLSAFRQKRWISFGPHGLTVDMANLYRLGYWLMMAGIFLTFL